jgi:hypothetical protein
MEITHTHWVIRHPGAGGSVVARFQIPAGRTVPQSVADYDNFTIETMPDQSALLETTIDQSGLSESEQDRLADIYPIL